MTCKERLEAYLRTHGVPFQRQHHPLAYTAQEVAFVRSELLPLYARHEPHANLDVIQMETRCQPT
jgi:hypothetical protein